MSVPSPSLQELKPCPISLTFVSDFEIGSNVTQAHLQPCNPGPSGKPWWSCLCLRNPASLVSTSTGRFSLNAEIYFSLLGFVPVFKIPMCGQNFLADLVSKQRNSFHKQGFGRAQAYCVRVQYFPNSSI